MTSLSTDQNINVKSPASQIDSSSFEKSLSEAIKMATDTANLANEAVVTDDSRYSVANKLVQSKEEDIERFNNNDTIKLLLPVKEGSLDTTNSVIISLYNHYEIGDSLAEQADDVSVAISNWKDSNETDKKTAKTNLIKETNELVDTAKNSADSAKVVVSEAKELSHEIKVGPFYITTDFQKTMLKDAKQSLENANDILSHAKETQSQINNMLNENK